ncbi:hypothetical protein [Desulfobulbus propionicus]
MNHWPMINRMAGCRFPREELAEEAALFVMDKLAEEDWRRLRAFTGQSTLTTYIGALSLRLLEDFARIRFGRVKPPSWVQRLGGIWETLFRLLCLERYTPAEAMEILATRQACSASVAEQAAFHLLGKIPHCGSHRGEQVELTEDLAAGEAHDEGTQPERQWEREEREQCLTALGSIVFDDHGDIVHTTRLLDMVLKADISLEPRDRLLLKLCFRDGVAVAQAGRMLGWNRHQVHGRLRRLLQRLRRDLADAGLDRELQLLLQS